MRVAILLFSCFAAGLVSAQSWEWGTRFDAPGTEAFPALGGVDAAGNSYLTVSSRAEPRSSISSSYFLLKHGSDGDLLWSKDITEYFGAPIATNSLGNSYLCFQDKLVCFSSTGAKLWQKSSNAMFRFASIHVKNGGLFTTGVDYASDTARAFVALYDFNGDLQEFTYGKYANSYCTLNPDNRINSANIGLTGPGYSNSGTLTISNFQGKVEDNWPIPHSAQKIFSDDESNILLYGTFGYDPITLSGKEFRVPQGTLSFSHYIVKYDAKGKLLWYKIISGQLGNHNISMDAAGNLFYIVDFSAEIKINDFELKGGTGGLLLVKFSPEGEMLYHFLTPSYNTGSYGYVYPGSIAVGPSSEVYFTGMMTGTLQFGPSFVETGSDMYTELFLGKINQTNTVDVPDDRQREHYPIHVHPNPSGSRFFVECPEGILSSVRYTVTDVQGRTVIESSCADANAQTFDVNLTGQHAGIYFLQVQNGTLRTVHKLVRQ